MRRFFLFYDTHPCAIIPFAMQVYIELAVLENFCMDYTLLYSAKALTKNAASYKRIALGSVIGAAFAVVFPLIKMHAAWAVVVKILSGLLICLVAGKFKNAKSYVKFAGAFLGFTALLGGALIGIFSLAGIAYSSEGGYLLSSVPIGIPMFGALLLIIAAKKLAKRFSKSGKTEVECKIFAGEKEVTIKGFFDSGNKVYSNGVPVSVIPKAAAEKLLAETRINENVKIHTVAGSKIIRVFTADKIEIDDGEKINTVNKVKIGVSPQTINRAVLHCDLLEE